MNIIWRLMSTKYMIFFNNFSFIFYYFKDKCILLPHVAVRSKENKKNKKTFVKSCKYAFSSSYLIIVI